MMKRSFLYVSAIVSFGVSLLSTIGAAQAQNMNSSPNGDQSAGAPMFPGVTTGTFGGTTPEGTKNRTFAPPMLPTTPTIPLGLQGASCGPIGPQGQDATVIEGVNTAGVVRLDKPMTATVLAINVVAASVILFTLQRKGAQMWQSAAVVASVTALCGFACALVSGF